MTRSRRASGSALIALRTKCACTAASTSLASSPRLSSLTPLRPDFGVRRASIVGARGEQALLACDSRTAAALDLGSRGCRARPAPAMLAGCGAGQFGDARIERAFALRGDLRKPTIASGLAQARRRLGAAAGPATNVAAELAQLARPPALRGAAIGSGWPLLAAAPAALGSYEIAVEGSADPLFEFALADQGAVAVAPLSTSTSRICGACSRISVCRRIVSRSPARLRSHSTTTGSRRPARRDAWASHTAADRPATQAKFAAQLVEQHVDRAGVDDRCVADRRFRGEDAQILGHLDHRPLDEQAVDARGLLQRLAQPVAGIGVELQRDRAEMQVEIESAVALLAVLGEQPGARRPRWSWRRRRRGCR